MGAKIRAIDLLPVAALGCYGLAVLPHVPTLLAHVAGTVLCFILAGVAVALAILPKDVGSGVRYTTTVACSLAAGVVGGMLLHLLPSGMNQFNWVTFAVITTLIAYIVARARGVGGPLHWTRPVSTISWVGCSEVAVSVAIVAGAIAVTLGSHNRETPFTELWLVPDTPLHTPLGAQHAVLGIKSHESATEDFTIVVNTSAQVMTARIALAPNQVWTQVVPVEGKNTNAMLFRGGITDQPYRTVWLVTR